MKTEKFYDELKGVIVDNRFDIIKYQKLLEKLEKAIREETCYKTSNKTRVNAIKRVAYKRNDRPVLTGYGIFKDYKVITDTYHLIAIKEDNMPLKLITTDNELANKVGKENCVCADYPRMESILRYDTSNELDMIDLNDLESFCKMHKKDDEVYQIGDQFFNPHYVKNVIDVLGKNVKIYYQGELRPLFFVNDKDEIGLVMPCKKY